MRKHLFCLGCLLGLTSGFVFAQSLEAGDEEIYPLLAEDEEAQTEWVDSLYSRMSLEEKVGQLFVAQVLSNADPKEIDYAKSLIRNYHIGGVIFSKGGPVQQARLTNEFQSLSEIPLVMSMDAEWGLAMRLDSTYAFPWNMTLGAIDDNKLIEKTGAQIAKQVKRIGMQMDYTPDVDINTNPHNPIIGNRSFGENKRRVTEKALAFMKGMQKEGVLTSAKHFPGHGDTDVDSHKALPVLDFTKERLDSIELFPYKRLIPKGLMGVMVGHLDVPSLDPNAHTPASLSFPIITGLLKDQLKFNGLVMTDALGMQGVTDTENPEKTGVDAVLAGNDILLMPQDIPGNIKGILEAYEEGLVTEERLAHSVKKILLAKYKVGLNHYEPVKIKNLVKDLNAEENDLLYEELMENAITVVKNDMEVVPVKDLDKKKIAYVRLGDASGKDFYEMLKKYTKVDRIEGNSVQEILHKLEGYDLVLVGYHKSNASPWKSYEFSQEELNGLYRIAKSHPTILSIFASPYSLLKLDTGAIKGIVIGYQNSRIAQEKAAQVIFGALGAKGRLPVSAGQRFPEGTRFLTQSIQRLGYGLPESVGMNSKKLVKVDSIAQDAVAKRMTPGMQILVARNNKVVWNKAYGHHTYEKKLPVKKSDLYDLASLTKILASFPLYLELMDQEKINLGTEFGDLLPFLKDSNKAHITLKEAFSHYGRFIPYIEFYRKTLDTDKKPSAKYYRETPDSVFKVKVAAHLYLREDYKDSVYQRIAESPLLGKRKYSYSDFPFYLSRKFFKTYYNTDMDTVLQRHFYQSIGANRTGYLPLDRFPKEEIAPTEKDEYFRNQTVLGYVHDEGAAMLGGVSGHAGLFGNANDVAKMMQLYLNKGLYGGKIYFSPKTFDTFNTQYYLNNDVRRALILDKPQKKGEVGPTSKYASKSSFGHLGFTGTKAWADPEENLLFVILTNYIQPDRKHRDYIRKDIRIKIEKAIYQAINIHKKDESHKNPPDVIENIDKTVKL